MEVIKIYAHDHQSLNAKIKDALGQNGRDCQLMMEKVSDDQWYAELTYAKRQVYVGLNRPYWGKDEQNNKLV